MRICSSLFTFFVMEASRENSRCVFFSTKIMVRTFSLRCETFDSQQKFCAFVCFSLQRALLVRQLTGDNENKMIRPMNVYVCTVRTYIKYSAQERRKNGESTRTSAPIKRIIRPRFHREDKRLNSTINVALLIVAHLH